MNPFKAVIGAALFTTWIAIPAYGVERCEVERGEYPIQHTMPDGKAVTLVFAANQCGPESRGVWVKVEIDGRKCGLGYRCERRHRGR